MYILIVGIQIFLKNSSFMFPTLGSSVISTHYYGVLKQTNKRTREGGTRRRRRKKQHETRRYVDFSTTVLSRSFRPVREHGGSVDPFSLGLRLLHYYAGVVVGGAAVGPVLQSRLGLVPLQERQLLRVDRTAALPVKHETHVHISLTTQ